VLNAIAHQRAVSKACPRATAVSAWWVRSWPRSRRRGAALEQALLGAAWDELNTVGYADLTMDGVAARAGTSKTVLYRRWPNRAQLVLAAMRQHGGSIANRPPETGSLRGDVLAVLRHMRNRFKQIGPDTVQGLIAELDYLPPDLFEINPSLVTTILQRAVERGEARPDCLTHRIAALPGDLLRHEMLTTRTPAPDRVLAEIVDEIFLPLVRQDR
jgi:AcrR family transcriptional regulator